MARRENMIDESDGLMHGNDERKRCMCVMMSKL